MTANNPGGAQGRTRSNLSLPNSLSSLESTASENLNASSQPFTPETIELPSVNSSHLNSRAKLRLAFKDTATPSRPSNVTTVEEYHIPRETLLAVQTFLMDGIDNLEIVDTVDDHPLTHSFIPGAYARQMKILAGHLIVGKIHRYPCFNFIMSGKVTVFSEDGRKDIVAPFFFVSQPGAKRVVVSHEETIWITCHGTHETDIDKIEAELIAPSYAALGASK